MADKILYTPLKLKAEDDKDLEILSKYLFESVLQKLHQCHQNPYELG